MPSFKVTESGLAVPASVLPEQARPAATAERSENSSAPTPPEGFVKDLKAYGRSVGQKYRLRWNYREQIWVIEVREANHSWTSIYAVNAGRDELGRFIFRQPMQRIDLMGLALSDACQQVNTGDIDKDIEIRNQLRQEYQRKYIENRAAEVGKKWQDAARDSYYHWKKLVYAQNNNHTSGYKQFWAAG